MAAVHGKPNHTVTVKFKEYTENTEIASILSLLDALQVKATLYADSIDASYYGYSKVRPSNWKEEYGLSDYLYFEAIPVKEIYY